MEQLGNQQARRPIGLSLLLILSFLGGGINFFNHSFTFLAFPMLDSWIEPMKSAYNSIFPKEVLDNALMMLEVNRFYYLIVALLNAVSFVGVLKMWKLNKTGVHFYALSQICMLIANTIFLYPVKGKASFQSDLLLTSLFIIVYFLYFKRLGLTDNGKDETDNRE